MEMSNHKIKLIDNYVWLRNVRLRLDAFLASIKQS